MNENPYKSPEEKSSWHEQAFKKHMGRLRVQSSKAIMTIILLVGVSFAIVMLVGFSLYIAIARICSTR